jgi:hypothetical protein
MKTSSSSIPPSIVNSSVVHLIDPIEPNDNPARMISIHSLHRIQHECIRATILLNYLKQQPTSDSVPDATSQQISIFNLLNSHFPTIVSNHDIEHEQPFDIVGMFG